MNRGEGKIAWPTYLHACMLGDTHALHIDARMQVCSPQVHIGARMRVFVQFSTFRSMHACMDRNIDELQRFFESERSRSVLSGDTLPSTWLIA